MFSKLETRKQLNFGYKIHLIAFLLFLPFRSSATPSYKGSRPRNAPPVRESLMFCFNHFLRVLCLTVRDWVIREQDDPFLERVIRAQAGVTGNAVALSATT